MSRLCRLFGHDPYTKQVWAGKTGVREGNGVWFDLHTHCRRCTANVPVGAFYVDDACMRAAKPTWKPK